MEENAQNANRPSADQGASTTSDAGRTCDFWLSSRGRYCAKPAEWKCTVRLTAQLVLYRCAGHFLTLQVKYRYQPNTLCAERIRLQC